MGVGVAAGDRCRQQAPVGGRRRGRRRCGLDRAHGDADARPVDWSANERVPKMALSSKYVSR